MTRIAVAMTLLTVIGCNANEQATVGGNGTMYILRWQDQLGNDYAYYKIDSLQGRAAVDAWVTAHEKHVLHSTTEAHMAIAGVPPTRLFCIDDETTDQYGIWPEVADRPDVPRGDREYVSLSMTELDELIGIFRKHGSLTDAAHCPPESFRADPDIQ